MKRKINLKAASLMILLALFMLPLVAQERPGQGQGQRQGRGQYGGQMTEENVKERVNNLAETLECTDQQKDKLLDIELEWYRKMQTERAKFQSGGGDFDREAMRAKMQEQRKLKDEKYKEVLTDAQMKKYNQLMEERMQARQQQRQGQDQGDTQGSQRQRGRGGN